MGDKEYSVEEHALYLSSIPPDELLRILAFDFRQPIMVSKGYCQYLIKLDEAELPIEKRKRIAENIQNHLLDMQHLLDALVKAINIQDEIKKSNSEG